jgi:hypothetical protein
MYQHGTTRPMTLLRYLFVGALLLSAAVAAAQEQTPEPSLVPVEVRPRFIEPKYHEIGVSQTIDDLTVTVESAYIDPLEMRLILTLSGPNAAEALPYIRPKRSTITDADGNSIGLLSGALMPNPDSPQFWIEANIERYLFRQIGPYPGHMRFPNFEQVPETLDLVLEVVYQPFNMTNDQSPEVTEEAPAPSTPDPLMTPKTFQLAFTAPIYPVRYLVLDESQTVDDVTVSLRDLVLRPSYVDIEVCHDLEGSWTFTYLNVVLDAVQGIPFMYVGTDPVCTLTTVGYNDLTELPSQLRITVDYLWFLNQQPQQPSLEEWEIIAPILAEQGIVFEIIPKEDGGYEYGEVTAPEGVEPWPEIQNALVEAELRQRVSGPWVFEIDVPEQENGE